MKVHYYFNPVTDEMITTMDGNITGGCSGSIARAVARIQSIDDPNSITFDWFLDVRNAEERIKNAELNVRT